MEYARHRRRKARGRNRKKSAATGEVGRAILALLMVGAIVYLISASAAGTWLAKNVMVPVFSALDSFKGPATSDAALGEDAAQSMQVSLVSTPEAVESDVTLPALSCYALQMGVYAQAENARTQAAQLRAAGAGGYVLEDGDRYRVIAAGYTDETAAREVKERLSSEGLDCTLYAIITPAATYRVSAESDQLTQVNAGFSSIANAYAALSEAVLRFDADAQSAAEGKAAATGVAETLRADMALLQGYAGEHTALNALLACYTDCLAAIEKAAGSEAAEASAFAADFKYAQLYVADRYAQLMRALG